MFKFKSCLLITFCQEVINQFVLGDNSLVKVHSVSKHFSSSSANRKNHDTMFQNHRYLPTSQLQQDLSGTRILARHELLRSCLRAKRSTHEHCAQLNVEPFLTLDEWKSVLEFEAALREASRLTTTCQNEEKLNSACGPVIRGCKHDRLSSDAMMCADVDDWSAKKESMRPTRSEVSASALTEAGKICLQQALLETERRHFNDKAEIMFAENNQETK